MTCSNCSAWPGCIDDLELKTLARLPLGGAFRVGRRVPIKAGFRIGLIGGMGPWIGIIKFGTIDGFPIAGFIIAGFIIALFDRGGEIGNGKKGGGFTNGLSGAC